MKPHKKLTLLRHAKAEPGDPGTEDRQRPLAPRGLRDASRMGRRLRESGARPSLIVTSPAKRTMQTARIVAGELGYPLEFLQREVELYLATPEAILAVVARQDDTFNEMVVCGHNPGLAELASRLTAGAVDSLPTGGVVVIDTGSHTWSGLRQATARLLAFDYPKRETAE